MDNPKCFISYSWDSKEHQEWVRKLGIHLQEFGVITQLDQWDLKPGQDMMAFMEYSIRTSDFVLLVCTKNYAQKSNDGLGGVGYEKSIVTGEMFSSTFEKIKYLPILRDGKSQNALPSFLKSRVFLDFRNDSEFETKIEELLRTIYNTPKFPKPKLGSKPDFTKPLRVILNNKNQQTKSLKFKGIQYNFILPEWWDKIEVDLSGVKFSDSYTIEEFCQEHYGADVGTKRTWKSALKAHAIYNHHLDKFPVYIAHCASAGGKNEFAVRIYTDLFNLVEFLDSKRSWYYAYLAYEAGGEYEILGQTALAISWYRKAIPFLGDQNSATKYYADQSINRINHLTK